MLYFRCRGEYFKVDEDGNMTQKNNSNFSEQWKFLGVSFHHWRGGIDIRYSKEIQPEKLINGLVWDLDHGTTRQWGGRYMGKLPRITQAWVE